MISLQSFTDHDSSPFKSYKLHTVLVKAPTVKVIRKEQTDLMAGKFLRMPFEAFMRAFAPKSNKRRGGWKNVFDKVETAKTEADLQDSFVRRPCSTFMGILSHCS